MRSLTLAFLLSAASAGAQQTIPTGRRPITPERGERHLTNVRQLTFGGENAEAYFSADGRYLTFQGRVDTNGCDQQFVVRVSDGGGLKRISPGEGKTTCGFFYGNDARVLFGSTHDNDKGCPAAPDKSKGYVWKLDDYDIYTSRRDGTDLKRLTTYGVYTAEAVVSPDGRRVVFTSLKDGDLDIYTMNVDGTNVRKLTSTPGYDGGPWWSPDGTKIVYRAWHPPTDSAMAEYKGLLAERLVKPNRMELWVMNADGSGQRQITSLGGANFGPSWTADGRRIIFSSNYKNPRSGNFDLYLVNLDGTGLEQITTSDTFDGFPMFSRDGKTIVWASNRGAGSASSTNLFVADWAP